MIRAGKVLIPIATVMLILAIIPIDFAYSLVMIVLGVVMEGVGIALIFIGVVRDRIKQKKEEDTHDLSQY
ncbi:hypothetical protein J416_12007 [Gracilibacillus halophilus YIM-C55.5]|uniref:Uncharacterized protein n=1 Tax=Gracilibacillus halophilus YIM-C55.5 TaxID=1308866 RepID=N4WJ96_9BACI|nr:hypothetical protein [Gracilibacillus halophilus]ENH96227.1 hypothetical protein J416_12007 [Gracilibacillus halophilus YIM-C55.5]